jgi:hypothetical protein
MNDRGLGLEVKGVGRVCKSRSRVACVFWTWMSVCGRALLSGCRGGGGRLNWGRGENRGGSGGG